MKIFVLFGGYCLFLGLVAYETGFNIDFNFWQPREDFSIRNLDLSSKWQLT